MSSPISRVEGLPSHGWPSNPSSSQSEFEERLLRRISIDLHNGPAQLISLALLQLDALLPAGRSRTGASAGKRGKAVSMIRASLQQAMQEIRAMSAGLAPSLDKLSLAQVVRSAVSHHELRTGATLAVQLHTLPGDGRLHLKNSIYRFIEEGLRFASAHVMGAVLAVEATYDGSTLCIEVIMGGSKPDVERLIDDGPSEINWLRRRVEMRGGEFEFEPLRGAETRLIARFRVTERNAFDD